MKKFDVSIKPNIVDFCSTSNVWITLNYKLEPELNFFKADASDEAVFGLACNSAMIPQLPEKSAPQEMMRGVLANSSFKGTLFHAKSDGSTLVYIRNQEYFWLLFKRSAKTVAVLDKESVEMKLEKDDFIVGFTNSFDASVFNVLFEDYTFISYSLFPALQTILTANSIDTAPVMAFDYSQKEYYAFTIKSTLNAVALTVDMIKNKVLKYHLEKVWKIETVLHEALVNAITYGNEMDYSRFVYISYEIGPRALRMWIRDMGDGFDVHNIMVPVGDEALVRISGRGIYIMNKFSEAFFYNAEGNEMLLYFEF